MLVYSHFLNGPVETKQNWETGDDADRKVVETSFVIWPWRSEASLLGVFCRIPCSVSARQRVPWNMLISICCQHRLSVSSIQFCFLLHLLSKRLAASFHSVHILSLREFFILVHHISSPFCYFSLSFPVSPGLDYLARAYSFPTGIWIQSSLTSKWGAFNLENACMQTFSHIHYNLQEACFFFFLRFDMCSYRFKNGLYCMPSLMSQCHVINILPYHYQHFTILNMTLSWPLHFRVI